ncbi:NAD(P)H-dependent oxidoreductase subunit E [Wukongibacter baidiensis]|uniref:NADH-quinone oxidoreductase subunit NuoE family protein n=1 Tax=Wukongibacter baidiensis TaxID=1723361 RepID=UPI003D7F2E93
MNKGEKTIDIIKRVGNTPDKLIEVLLEVQNQSEENYITEEELKIISRELDVPISKAFGVASFYSMLSTKKRGKYVIQICNSGPCYVKNSKKVAKTFEAALGIKMGEITEDGLFSLEYTSCIGACDQAPAVKINDEVYGNLDKEKIYDIINSLRKEEK